MIEDHDPRLLLARIDLLEATVEALLLAVPAAVAGCADAKRIEQAMRNVAEGHLMSPSSEGRERQRWGAEARIRLADAIAERVALREAGLL